MKQGLANLSLGMILMLHSVMAFADSAPATSASDAAPSSAITQGVLLVAFAVIFYFLLIRPQSKRAKEHKTLVESLQKGDEVLTTGGLVGKISRTTDSFCVLQVAEGVEVTIQRQAIAGALPKGTMKGI